MHLASVIQVQVQMSMCRTHYLLFGVCLLTRNIYLFYVHDAEVKIALFLLVRVLVSIFVVFNVFNVLFLFLTHHFGTVLFMASCYNRQP